MDKDTNSIILTGIPMIHHRMSQLMKELDIRKGQVLIEAKVVEVSHEASSRFGFEWELARNLTDPTRTIKAAQSNFNLDTSNQLDSVAGLRLSFLKGGEWTALLNAYATSEQANLLSCPHLVAMDGETAKLHVGEEIPILKESRVDSNNNPVNSYDYEKVGIDLSIKPTIVGDNEVVLVIKQEVSTLLQYNEERLTHRIGERLAETTVIMKDRHTLVIGGLLEDSRRKSNTGVPVLREIPVLGKLFSQQAQNSSPEKTELLIFITPRIMKSHDEADDITEEMQERHPNTYSTSGEDFRL
jgi:general secretion pathway protein D